jgi:short-subunit dehydrogenase
MAADVSRSSELDQVVARANAEFGQTDILVNNAALETNGAFDGFSEEELTRLIHVDLIAPMLLTSKVLPGMLQRRRGHIVNISSLAGKSATPYNVPYAAAKGGLIAFTHSLRAEVHDRGVSASVVCPGFVSEAGMFATKKKDHGVTEPKMLGASAPSSVAAAVVRALEDDVLEILVNPGPMRLLQAVNQLFPEMGGWVVNRMGVADMFRKVGESERNGGSGKRV